MSKIPLSYFTCSKNFTDALLPNLFLEFAANGAENVVIDETMACKILDDPRYYSNLERFARGAGIKLFEIHAPFGECWDLNCSVKARRPALVEGHIKCMNYAAEAGCKTYVIHVGAWDCIFRPEISIEKMRELALDNLEKLLPEAEKAGIVQIILLLPDLLDQGHQTAAQRGKKYVALAHGQPVFVFVQPVIIGVHIRCAVFGKADIGFEDLFQVRLKERKIVCFLGSVPYVV